MNDTLPYLPCLKHKEGASTAISAMNATYTEIELFIIVLNAVNLTVLTTFYAAVRNEFPTNITKLTVQLTRVCDQNKEHKILLNDLTFSMGLKTRVGPGDRASMNSATEATPCKIKNRKRGGGSPATATNSVTCGGYANGAR